MAWTCGDIFGKQQRLRAAGPRRKHAAELNAPCYRVVEHRHEGEFRKPRLQRGIGARGEIARIGHIRDNYIDATAARFRRELDVVGDGEKLIECLVADVDDLGGRIVHNEAIEQRHLAARFRQ